MEFTKIEPSIWKPKTVGESVEGVLVSVEDGKKFENTKVYHLEKDGVQTIVFGSTVLKEKMAHIQVGEYCKIQYDGMKDNAKKQKTNMFTVFKAKLPA